jgi:hypothetical protein
MKVLATALAIGIVAALTGCSDAQLASHNLSKAADNFEVNRRIVFINTWTDTYLLTVEGRCSIEASMGQLEVTCKDGPTSFKKHFLGLSKNVTYVAEQLDGVDVSVYHYRVIFKPSALIPHVEMR